MKPVFHLKVERAKLVTDIDFQNHLHSLEGCECDVTVEKHKNKRSVQQNKLYWAMLKIISEDTGHSKDYLHEFFKHKFLGDKIEVFGEPFVYSRSTTKLTTDELSVYLGDIRFYIMDATGIDLPIE